MRIIHLEGFSAEERQHYKRVIYENVTDSMKCLLEASQRFGYSILEQNLQLVERFMELRTSVDYSQMTPELFDILKVLWKDPAVEQTVERSNEFTLHDSTE
jgi:guanine nucleotide-binding protein subunit alpha